jgi:hypothetical protein
MRAIKLFLRPLGYAVVAFFRHDLALRRSRRGLEFVLHDPANKDGKRKSSRADESSAKERKELKQMLQELHTLLDEQPDSRHTMRHIVFVQHALQRKGLRALHKVPLDVLQRALAQLEGMVTNWTPVGLASLRSKMAVAIIDREHMDPDAEADAYRTAAVLDSGLGPPSVPALPEVTERSDDEALAAAYATLAATPPVGAVELQGELGSRSAKAVAPPTPRVSANAGEIKLRELQS